MSETEVRNNFKNLFIIFLVTSIVLLGILVYYYNHEKILNAEILNLQSQNVSCQSQLEEVVKAAKQIAAKKQNLPVDVNYRKAVMGTGKVLVITNQMNKVIPVTLKCYNARTKESKSFRIELKPSGVTEFGHIEGWAFFSNDEIKIISPDYEDYLVTMP